MLTVVPSDRVEMARRTARLLLEVSAVNFRADPPFTLTSGRQSPVYIDCRRLISFPRLRRTLTAYAVETLLREVGAEAFDAVAGGETAGIPYAAWLADALDLPMLYVRKKPKGFGRDARIEGALSEGQRVLLVEDLATDGGSKLSFVSALREAGARVNHVFVVFHYGIFPEAIQALEAEGVRLHALTTWHEVVAEARAAHAFPAEVLKEVTAFLDDPKSWSTLHEV